MPSRVVTFHHHDDPPVVEFQFSAGPHTGDPWAPVGHSQVEASTACVHCWTATVEVPSDGYLRLRAEGQGLFSDWSNWIPVPEVGLTTMLLIGIAWLACVSRSRRASRP